MRDEITKLECRLEIGPDWRAGDRLILQTVRRVSYPKIPASVAADAKPLVRALLAVAECGIPAREDSTSADIPAGAERLVERPPHPLRKIVADFKGKERAFLELLLDAPDGRVPRARTAE